MFSVCSLYNGSMPIVWGCGSMAGMWLLEAASVVFVVGLWFMGLVTLMMGAWCAVDRYKGGTRKDRIVIGSSVLLLSVILWGITTLR
jgi:hypothetical protein